MPKETRLQRFERLMLPHMDAAYNLARWLTGNEQDARDVVQEAYIRAFNAFGGFTNTNSAGWLLTIVRNAGYTLVKRERHVRDAERFDESVHSGDFDCSQGGTDRRLLSPDVQVAAAADSARVHDALKELPVEYREVIVLRELEECSYREIAEIVGIPMGTVMSRLSRARKQLQHILAASVSEVNRSEL